MFFFSLFVRSPLRRVRLAFDRFFYKHPHSRHFADWISFHTFILPCSNLQGNFVSAKTSHSLVIITTSSKAFCIQFPNTRGKFEANYSMLASYCTNRSLMKSLISCQSLASYWLLQTLIFSSCKSITYANAKIENCFSNHCPLKHFDGGKSGIFLRNRIFNFRMLNV